MNSPNATGQTAIRVLGGDVVGSLQHTPSMDSMRAPALTSPMNFSATSSVSQPPRWMPKERRRRDQRGDHASAERLDEAFERPLPPIRLRPLFWIGEWTTRQGVGQILQILSWRAKKQAALSFSFLGNLATSFENFAFLRPTATFETFAAAKVRLADPKACLAPANLEAYMYIALWTASM